LELHIVGLYKNFHNFPALKNVTYRFSEGIYGLIGPNGSGKTTLLRLLCNLLRPSQGEILYDGMSLVVADSAYRDILGYLPQDFGYYPDFTCGNFLEYIAVIKELPKDKIKQRIKEVLTLMELQEVQNKKIKQLSGGMRQRIGIAQAILNNPKLLILDEPTVGLDPQQRSSFRNLLWKISPGKTIILSTHIVSDIEHTASKLLLLKNGEVIQDGSPDQLLHTIEGKVWEKLVPLDQVNQFIERYHVINQTLDRKGCQLRFFSQEKPDEMSNVVKANLEDLYLYYFQMKEG
jgi:ABC-2 type transport system ATP-binding protein